MKREKKSAFEIKWEKETRKRLIKYVAPRAVMIFLIFFIFCAMAGSISELGIIGFWTSQVLLSIAIMILYIALIPFMWFMSKKDFRKRAYDKMLEDMSKSLVEKVMTPGEPTRVILTKSKGDFGDFVLKLQKHGKIEIFAVLGEKDNLIAIYAVLKGEDEKCDLEVVTKEEFCDCYQFVDNS